MLFGIILGVGPLGRWVLRLIRRDRANTQERKNELEEDEEEEEEGEALDGLRARSVVSE